MEPHTHLDFFYLSDLHLELRDVPISYDELSADCSSRVLLICGDLGDPMSKWYKEFLTTASQHFSHVFLISGNHEYYSYHSMQEIDDQIDHLCSGYANVHYLNNRSYDLTDQLTIVGTTLWSRITRFDQQESIRDFKKIHLTEKHTKITPNDVNRLYENNTQWLRHELERLHALQRKIIVMTHHTPSYQLIAPKFQGNPINCYFANHLEELIKEPVIAWFCGHTHQSCLQTINGVYCGINSLGYCGEETGFDLTSHFSFELKP